MMVLASQSEIPAVQTLAAHYTLAMRVQVPYQIRRRSGKAIIACTIPNGAFKVCD